MPYWCWEWGKESAPYFTYACDGCASLWWGLICRLSIWNISGWECLLDLGKDSIEANKAFCCLFVFGQREGGRWESTRTQSSAWGSKVTRCSWLVTSSLVLRWTQLLQELLLLGPTDCSSLRIRPTDEEVILMDESQELFHEMDSTHDEDSITTANMMTNRSCTKYIPLLK